jgi:hypothetical protein
MSTTLTENISIEAPAPASPPVIPEASKGYWTDGHSGFLDIAVLADSTDDENVSIVLSSNHWYRVQMFDLDGQTCAIAWNYIKALLRECGRKLPFVSDEQQFIYRITNLCLQQVNQMYYLLKHSLTSGKISFTISHSLTFPYKKPTVVAPKPKQHRRLRRNKNREVISSPNKNWIKT